MNPSPHQIPTKEDGGGKKEENIESKEIKAKESNNINFHNNLELRLGFPSTHTNTKMFKETMGLGFPLGTHFGPILTHLLTIPMHDPNGLDPRLFSGPPNPFIDPWSLAARQQKAVLEHAHKHTNSSSKGISSPSPSTIGWPPVCAFRRNMVNSQAMRPEAEDERQAKRAKIDEVEVFNSLDEETKSNVAMFVKVNMEGYAVGRKIDLKAHSSYDSLSQSLKKMFRNFLSLDYSISEEYIGETLNRDYLLLYEDHEGDRMLVGDVPWEMFLTSVKRLYIVRSPKSHRPAELHVASPREH